MLKLAPQRTGGRSGTHTGMHRGGRAMQRVPALQRTVAQRSGIFGVHAQAAGDVSKASPLWHVSCGATGRGNDGIGRAQTHSPLQSEPPLSGSHSS
jgi:hypothetical protein